MTHLIGTSGHDTIDGTNVDDVIDGLDGWDVIHGGAGADTLNGGDGGDNLVGGAGDDILNGGDGDDYLNDDYGSNTFIGGAGNDTITSYSSGGNIDAGEGDDDVTLWDWNLATNNLGSSDDVVNLGSGDDKIQFHNLYNAKIITGGTGKDTFSPGYYDSSSSYITVITDFQAGTDGDVISLNDVLSKLTGYSSGNPFGGGYLKLVQSGKDVLLQIDQNGTAGDASYLTLIKLQNIQLNLLTADNFGGFELVGFPQNFIGTDYKDVLVGNGRDNFLSGLAGDDSLNGLAGADTMNGGTGNDTYIVDNAGDVIIEGVTGGTDSVYSTTTYSLTGSYLENLFLTGTANINATGNAGDNLLVGNAGANVFNGGAGADTMNGGAGDDTYYVDNAGDVIIEGATGGNDTAYTSLSYSLTGSYLENLFVTGTANVNASGNAGDNLLVGNSGNNIFNGGAGADTMNGGLGDDIYYIDNAGDVVVEGNGGGTDTIYSAISYSLGGRYVEKLFLTGSANVNATGNAGDNLLVGNDGNNVINGGGGADSMNGGLGNDTYYVDNAADVVVEGNGGGTDSVISSISYSLSGSYVENLTLTGSANINATGNGLVNHLIGNSGNNTLNGGGGSDILTGGDGNDIFYFGAGSGADTITDFSNDTINLNAYSHGGANGGGITITQVGSNTLIDLGGGNTITLTGIAPASLTGHIVW